MNNLRPLIFFFLKSPEMNNLRAEINNMPPEINNLCPNNE